MWRRISYYSDCPIYIYIVVEKNSTQFHPYFVAFIFFKTDVSDEPDDHEYLEKNC